MSTPDLPADDLPGLRFTPLKFDAREFMQFVEDESLSDAEAEQLLRAIWEVVVAFVDLAFGIHPVQQVVDGFSSGGGSEIPAVLSCADSFSEIASNKAAAHTFRVTAAKEES